MAKLTYWYAQRVDDSESYSVIAKTKKEAIAERSERMAPDATFGPVQKRTIDYTDAFDLFRQVTGEGGGRGYGKKES